MQCAHVPSVADGVSFPVQFDVSEKITENETVLLLSMAWFHSTLLPTRNFGLTQALSLRISLVGSDI